MMKKKMIMYLFIGLGLMGLFLLEPDAIYAAGSGVTELDNAANKTISLRSSLGHYQDWTLLWIIIRIRICTFWIGESFQRIICQ